MSNSRLKPSSVHAIRNALTKVPGALRHEPVPEESGIGESPGAEIVIHDPANRLAIDMPLDPLNEPDDGDDGPAEGPAIIFEIPPQVTDATVRNVLGDERIGELRHLSQIRGVDALGWYLSFHQLSYQYGIYIRFEAVLWLALEFFHDVNVAFARKLDLAFQAILRHELFHFETDCMIANWELGTGVEVFWSSRELRNAAGYNELEEGLANAYMLRGFKYPGRLLGNAAGAYAALKKFCAMQPPGYKDGPWYLRSRELYLRECSQLSDNYHRASATPWRVPDEFDTLMLYHNVAQIDWTRCPIILQDQHNLQELLGIYISYFSTVTGIVETEKFQRALRKLDRTLEKKWEDAKATLAITTTASGQKFSPWPRGGPDWYSVRVGRNFRAHLRYERSSSTWFAEKIGSHTGMGHG